MSDRLEIETTEQATRALALALEQVRAVGQWANRAGALSGPQMSALAIAGATLEKAIGFVSVLRDEDLAPLK